MKNPELTLIIYKSNTFVSEPYLINSIKWVQILIYVT